MIEIPKIAITGITGNLGGMVSRLCKKNGIEVRNLARNVGKAEKLGFSNVFKSSYDKSADTVKSLEGIEVLFMVSYLACGWHCSRNKYGRRGWYR